MKTFFLAALILLSTTAAAQPYIAGGLASTHNVAGKLSETRTGLALGAGYRFGQVAGEAACAGVDIMLSTNCSLAGIGSIPVAGGFSLIGKAGVHYLRGNLTEKLGPGVATSSPTPHVSWSGWAPGAGIGAEYVGASGIGARLLLEQTGRVGPLEHARTVSASLLYQF